MIKAKKLEWDTIFFGIDVFSIRNSSEKELCAYFKEKRKGFYYIFLGKELFSKSFLTNHNCILVDTKVIFEKKLKKLKRDKSHIKEYIKKEVDSILYELAFESGKHSRFLKDKRIDDSKFFKMYSKWIEKSVKSDNINIFVYLDNGKIKGFVTLFVENEVGNIGLIAVNPNSQGKGIGRKLIGYCETKLVANNIHTLRIPTQKDNSATLFYERLGYKIKSKENIYHLINK